jgi:hypothetical protein
MQLEHICDMELVYREESLYANKFLLVRPLNNEPDNSQRGSISLALGRPI